MMVSVEFRNPQAREGIMSMVVLQRWNIQGILNSNILNPGDLKGSSPVFLFSFSRVILCNG